MSLLHSFPAAPALFAWALRVSAEASVLAGLVVLAQWLLRHRVSARWRYNLWLLVLLRLVLPVFPQSRYSPFNWMKLEGRHEPAQIAPAAEVHRITLPAREFREDPAPLPIPIAKPLRQQDSLSITRVEELEPVQTHSSSPDVLSDLKVTPSDATDAIAGSLDREPSLPAPPVAGGSEQNAVSASSSSARTESVPEGSVRMRPAQPHRPDLAPIDAPRRAGFIRMLIATARGIRWFSMFAALWILGAAVIAIRVLGRSIRLHLRVRRFPGIQEPEFHALLSRCCREMGLRRAPRLVESPSDLGPALLGVLRPRLLVPRRVLASFDRNELRLLLVHELVHLRRGDVAVNWLLSLLQAIHWFNPILWWSFARLRADRELACDEAVLNRSSSSADDRGDYGRALIKLLETLSRGPALPGAVGVLDGSRSMRNTLMRRRITMIAHYEPSRRRWSIFGTVVSLVITGIALTGAVRAQVASPADQPAVMGSGGMSGQPRGMVGAMPGMPGEMGMPGMSAMPGQGMPTRPGVQTPVPAPAQPNQPGYGRGGFGGAMPGAPGGLGQPGPQPGQPPNPEGVGEAVPYAGHVEGPDAAKADAATAERLRKSLKASFDGVDLSDTLAYLADGTGADIFLDRKALEGLDVSPVTLQLRQPLPAGEVLRLILRSAGGDALGYGIFHGVITVTSSDQLERSPVTRAYDISDFKDSADQLVAAVTRTVSPDSWREVGGRGSIVIVGKKMLVMTSEPRQREIAKLLALLREQPDTHAAAEPNAPTASDREITLDPGNTTMRVPADIADAAMQAWQRDFQPRIIFIAGKPENLQEIMDQFQHFLRSLEQNRDHAFRQAMQSAHVDVLRDELESAEQSLREATRQYGSNHANVRALQGRVEDLRQRIQKLEGQPDKQNASAEPQQDQPGEAPAAR